MVEVVADVVVADVVVVVVDGSVRVVGVDVDDVDDGG